MNSASLRWSIDAQASATRCSQSASADRSQVYKDLSVPFYGANRSGSTVSQGVRDAFWLMSMRAGLKGVLDCIKAFSETDFTKTSGNSTFRP